MPRKIQLPTQTIGINATLQETGGPMGEARALAGVAKELESQRDQVQNQAFRNAELEGQKVISERLFDIEQRNQNNPEQLTREVQGFTGEFLSNIADPEMKARFDLQITRQGQSALARANAGRQRIIDDQARESNLTALQALTLQTPKIAEGFLSDDDAIALSSRSEFQEAIIRVDRILGATNSKGESLFSPEFRVSKLQELKETALVTGALTWIKGQPDKIAAAKQLEDGELILEMPDGEGGFMKVNVSDEISNRSIKMVKSEAKRMKAEADKQLKLSKEADLETQLLNEDGLMEIIKDPELTNDERVFKVNEMDMNGQIRDEMAVEMRRYLSSDKAINAATNNEVMGNIIKEVYDANTIREESPKDYLVAIRNIKMGIMKARADGKLEADDEVKLDKQITTLTSAKVAEATRNIAYSFGNARKVIESALPPEKRNEAIRRMFYEGLKLQEQSEQEGVEFDKSMYEGIAKQIVDEGVAERRIKTEQILQQLNNPDTSSDADTEFLKSKGYSMRDAEETAKNNNVTVKQVIELLRAQ